jgi:hypothetical protein
MHMADGKRFAIHRLLTANMNCPATRTGISFV